VRKREESEETPSQDRLALLDPAAGTTPMRQLPSRQAEALPEEIETIKSLDLDSLGLQWRNAFGKRAPKGLPKALLSKFLIYRLQADALGDLDSELARLLDGDGVRGARAGGDNPAKATGRAACETLTIKPGSVLVRDWRGRTHRVMALEVGFAWEGTNYRSLSEVARAITGTRWNGRRFFGVDKKADRGSAVSEDMRGVAPVGERTQGAAK